MNDVLITLPGHWTKRMFILITLLFLLPSFTVAQETNDNADKAIQLFNKGQDAHEKHNYSDAIELYGQAIALVPEFPEAELQRGNAYLALSMLGEAESSFRRALSLRPEWTLALSSLGSTLVTVRRFDDARPLLEKAIELDDQNFQALSAMAELLINTRAGRDPVQRLLAQISVLTLKANPTASIWAARSALEKYLGNISAAKSSLARAIAIDPGNLTALFQQAEIALAENDVELADSTLLRIEALAKGSDRLRSLRARIFAARGRLDDAVKMLDTISSPNAEVREFRDQITALNSTSTAELESRLTSDPRNAAALGRLCELFRLDDPLKSLEYCRRASEAEPQNVKHAIGYGAALVQAKRYDEAVNLFARLTIAAPDNITLRAGLATALFQLKRFSEAKKEFEWLVEKQPTQPIPYYFLAITFDQLQLYMDALANYQKFLSLADPKQLRLEIDQVNLRIPSVQKLLKEKKGKRG